MRAPSKKGIVAASDGTFMTTFKAPFDFGVNVIHNVNATQGGVEKGIMNTTARALTLFFESDDDGRAKILWFVERSDN